MTVLIIMEPHANEEHVERVVSAIEQLKDFRAHVSQGVEHTIIGVIGNVGLVDKAEFETLPGVGRVVRIMHPFKLANRQAGEGTSGVRLNGVGIGADKVVMMAGPCAVESEELVLEVARAVRKAGATVLRGGAFKPRTSPYSFQGLGEEGLRYLARAREETGLLVITEVLTPEDVPLVSEYADILQVGARSMQNFSLLQEIGKTRKPVMLKRGMMSSVKEWLLSAEYILSGGNPHVMLCERGIRTFEDYTRNTLDLSAVPLIKELSHLPIIVDPSHGTGRWDLVPAMARAAVAAGADGLIIEVHPRPEEALSDGAQSLKFETFGHLMHELEQVAQAIGRSLARSGGEHA